nr:MAG TPA_asm: hypothetical protein [Caudoviricetes sp.]
MHRIGNQWKVTGFYWTQLLNIYEIVYFGVKSWISLLT